MPESREGFRTNRPASSFTIATLTDKLIREYDTPQHGDREKRNLAADVAALLCRHYDEAYELVCQNTVNYARLMCEVGDACTYHPNGIDVIRKVTNRPEVRTFLEDLRNGFCGLAGAEATNALASCNASAKDDCPHLHSRDWEDPVKFEAWISSLSEKEKDSLDLYFGIVVSG